MLYQYDWDTPLAAGGVLQTKIWPEENEAKFAYRYTYRREDGRFNTVLLNKQKVFRCDTIQIGATEYPLPDSPEEGALVKQVDFPFPVLDRFEPAYGSHGPYRVPFLFWGETAAECE